MFLRWLHKSWKYFWRIVLALLLAIVILAGAAIGLLQLDATQNYLADRIEQQVEQNYKADLSIGDIDGFLPFGLTMENIVLTQKDFADADTLAAAAKIESQIDLWGLLQNKITITGFSVEQPRIWLREGKKGQFKFLEKREKAQPTAANEWFNQVEAVAPTMEIFDGTVYINYIKSFSESSKVFDLPPSFSISNINADFFVEWNEGQRYLNIESFSAEMDELEMENIAFSGQIYNDERYLELNSFFVKARNSEVILNGEVEGFNLYQPDLLNQLLTARYNLSVESNDFYPAEFKDLIPAFSGFEDSFFFQLQTEGTADSLIIDRAMAGTNGSFIEMSGLAKNLRESSRFEYQLRIDSLNVEQPDIRKFVDTLSAPQYRALANLSVSGKASGTLDSASVSLDVLTQQGQVSLQGGSQLKEPYRYYGSVSGKNVDISPVAAATFDTTSLNFNASIDGQGFTLNDAASEFTATFYDSRVDSLVFGRLELTSSLINGLWEQQYEYQNGEKFIEGSGRVDFSREVPPLSMQGNAQNINLANIFGQSTIASTQLNFNYNIEVEGLQPNQVQGRANLDIQPSVIGGDTVQAHQIYMDLSPANEENRTFRLTSSLFDMNINGRLIPDNIIDQAQYWSAYLSNRFKAEILMNAPADSIIVEPPAKAPNVVFNGMFRAKNLGLIKKYVPRFPEIEAHSEVTFNVNTDGIRLLLSAEMQADSLRYNQWNFKGGRTQLTASFRSDRTLKEFSSVDLQTRVDSIQTGKVDLDSVGINLSFNQDSVHYAQQVGSISDDARFNIELNSSLTDSSIAVSVRNFFLGNGQYAWVNQQTPALIYKRNGSIVFNDFRFQNKEEYFQLNGTLSANRSDSLKYVIRDVQLGRISDLIKGKVNFSGILNGTFITRSLARQPTVQGELMVDRFALDGRLVGDISFNSQFNPEKGRFDTEIKAVTDSSKYASYMESNDNIGQDIRLDGYFVTPDPDVQQDSLFYFDADIRQVDMWVIPLLLDNIFMEMEGQAFGEGYITGNFDDFDFHADFQAQNVYAKPRFVSTNYFVNGHVAVDRQEGVELDSLNVIDTKGGSGTVWGTIDLNDFKPITYLDLSADLDGLQFLNSSLDPDVPFYGNVSGSGLVRLTGSNTDLYLRSDNPVQLTDNSEISIPLLEETELNKTGRFIRFVDSFENLEPSAANGSETGTEEINEEELEAAIESMTFSERFNLDLQFVAPNSVRVNLIFDPVTGEILTSRGTGQLRITMQNQNVQMFGQYSINSGSYQFVTGEIISRELELEPGGTINWQGEPDNARLDISAVYHARPNIATLTSEGPIESQDQTGQQVPIDLIVEINGTLNSVENNYFFRLPATMDLSSNSTLSYTINQINRDEQQKLLQATSILFTGQFIPTGGTGSATATLGESLSKGSTVLNPLISNQVISPLLSNQINALLNSDVSRLDVDFNLNAYNEVDLGIALRLYNDRLVLRREGQITGGPQSTLGDRIGDLNATYRIQRGLSLTAFHRQDQVLGSLGATGSQAGDVTPTVDGIGLEAQVNFNTWQGLMNRISGTFNSIFGIKNRNSNKAGKNKGLAEQKAKEEKQEF